MDLEVLKWQIRRGSLMRRLILKMLMFGAGLIVISFVQMGHEVQFSEPWMLNESECPLNFGHLSFNFTQLFGVLPVPCKENEVLAKNVFQELMVNSFLDSDVKALCVGEGSDAAVLALRELGFSDVSGVNRHPFFSLLKRRFVYELDFGDSSFDFVFSRALDRVSVPALLVLEIERVLRAGGTGAMLLGANGFTSGNLVRSATPVSSFLKSSDVVHVCPVGPYVLVLFKKRFQGVALFDQFKLPDHCPSVMNNKPFMPYIEPVGNKNPAKFDSKISYLPNLMNISSRNKLVYINVGAGELVDAAITKMFSAHYPIPQHALDVYVIDHNTTALSLYVKTPGITFVYDPKLAGEETASWSANYTDDYLGDDKDFDFVRWFDETVNDGEFVVLMMNARAAELQILDDLFKTGLICRVDELFLRCSDAAVWKPARCGDCTSLFKGLRNRGVFAHWLGE
nr:Methyltransferase PMT28 [Ipomoea batatas]